MSELRRGSKDWVGRDASKTPTSTSWFSTLEFGCSLGVLPPLGSGANVELFRARLGGPRLGRSGVGLLSIATSLAPGPLLNDWSACSSSCSKRLF